MSNFDDFFEKKLNEEQQFEQAKGGWTKLANQLQRHDMLLHAAVRKLLIWKIAAAASMVAVVATSAIGVYYKLENNALQAQMRTQRPESDPTLLNVRNAPPVSERQKNEPENKLNDKEKTRSFNQQSHASNRTTPSNSGKKRLFTNQDTDLQKILQEERARTEQAEQALQMQLKQQDSLLALIENLSNRIELHTGTAPLDFLPSKTQSIDSKPTKGPGAVEFTPNIIKPARSERKLAIGIQQQIGGASPKLAGVSPLHGTGVTAEYRIFKNIWLQASADWFRFELQTDTLIKRFKLPDPPTNHPHPNYQDVQVSSNLRHQQFGLGFRWKMPVRWVIQPSVRLAHVWTRALPGTVIFRYDDQNHPVGPNMHDPDYRIIKTPAQHFAQTWRLGAGLEYQLGRWGMRISWDYARHLTEKERAFNAWYASAGLSYQLF